MLTQIDGSIYFWPRTFAAGAALIFRVVAWILRPFIRTVAMWAAGAEIRRLKKEIYEAEIERRVAVRMAERAIAQRDRYYGLLSGPLSTKSTA